MIDEMARVAWHMGQTLLPEHFIAQEDSLLAETQLRMGQLGLPLFGVGRLKWNDSLLAEGVVSIQQMTLVLPSGRALDVPGNSTVDSFNLNVLGATRVPVYLHLTSKREAPAASAARRAEDGDTVDRVLQRIEISSEQTSRKALETMKLAEFVKSAEGTWSLSEEYAPPLVQVGTSPFLAGMIDRLQKTMERFHLKLEEDIAASYLGGEGLMGAKLCLEGVYRLRRFLMNLRTQIRFHPYYLYEALKTFYTQICLYQNATPEHATSPYRHDQLAQTFAMVVDPLLHQLQVTRGQTPYLSFERKEGLFIIPELPKEVRLAKEVYFLVQKPKVSEVFSLEGLKLASRARLPTVHQLSLQGIALRRIDRPPFQHQFGAEVEFFLLGEGEEWDRVLREGSIAFFDRPALANVNAYLYWRVG